MGLMGVWLHSVARDQCCPRFGHWDNMKQTNNESAPRIDHQLACIFASAHAEHRSEYKHYDTSSPPHIFQQWFWCLIWDVLFWMWKDWLLCAIQSCYLSLTPHLSFSTSHLSKSILVLLFSTAAWHAADTLVMTRWDIDQTDISRVLPYSASCERWGWTSAFALNTWLANGWTQEHLRRMFSSQTS